jgi:polysaccharide export outer membrane protein
MGVQLKSASLVSMLAVAAIVCGAGSALAQYEGPAISSPSPAAAAPIAAMQTGYDDLKIQPGDIIAIATLGVPELTTSAPASAVSISSIPGSPVVGLKVDLKGQIQLPYLGTVVVAGRTPAETAVYLARALQERGILVDPQISVGLVASPTRVITVIGEVLHPMPVPAYPQLRLLDVISACGGFTPLASHTITVRRSGEPDPIMIELATDPKTANLSNIPVLPGDMIVVPKVGNVFVLGEVKNEEAFPLSTNTPVTVLRAISMAGGVKYSAALSKVRIIRATAGNQHVEIMLDLRKVMEGKQQDVALVSDDVLFIPANTFKSMLVSGGASVAATALYGATYAASVAGK